MTAHGMVHWTELNTRDIEKAKSFYAATLGWTFSDMPIDGGTYVLIMMGEQVVGGIFDINAPQFEGMPPHWFTYFACDDIDAMIAKITAAGGTVICPPWDVPTVGRIAIVKDSTGAVSGWMSPAPMQGT